MGSSQLQKQAIYLLGTISLFLGAGCTTLPEAKIKKYTFPKGVYYETPKDLQFERLGLVKVKVNYPSMTEHWDEQALCANFFNKAAHDLLRASHEKGGDAVIEVKSVVYLGDGKKEMYARPECFDDGQEGQALAQGEAVKLKPVEKKKE